MYKAKPILKLFPTIENGVLGYFLMDRTDYFNYIKQQIAKTGYACDDGGNFNGYVILTKDHPLFNKHYDFINKILDDKGMYIHGGLTFSAYSSELFDLVDNNDLSTNNFWVVGFDTRHANDNSKYWTEERTWKETLDLLYAIQCLHKLTKDELAKYEDETEL